jgi:hypothetical protein
VRLANDENTFLASYACLSELPTRNWFSENCRSIALVCHVWLLVRCAYQPLWTSHSRSFWWLGTKVLSALFHLIASSNTPAPSFSWQFLELRIKCAVKLFFKELGQTEKLGRVNRNQKLILILKSSVFLYIPPSRPMKVNRCFGGTCRLCVQGRILIQASNQLTASIINGLQGAVLQRRNRIITTAFRTGNPACCKSLHT